MNLLHAQTVRYITANFNMDCSLFLVGMMLLVSLSKSQPLDFRRPGCDDTMRTKAIKDIRAAQLNLGTCQAILKAMDVDDIVSFDNNVIFTGTSQLSWTESQNYCRRYNASLAVIENEKVNNEIKDKLMEYRNAYGLGGREGFWIGGQRFNDTVWIWDKNDSQVQILLFDWAPFEPKSNASCIQMWTRYDYQWDDVDCDLKA